MPARDENPYAAPNAAELPTPPEVSWEQPRLREFLLQGCYAALLTAPISAAYFDVMQLVGLKITGPIYERAVLSTVGIGIAAVGDGLIAMLCWKIVTNRPRSLSLLAAGMGSRMLAILCQAILVATGIIWDFSARSQFMFMIFGGFFYGLPALFLTLIFLRILNRRTSWRVYSTVFMAASVGGYALNLTLWAICQELVGTTAMRQGVFVPPVRDSLFLCVLAAALWFSVRLSRPAVIQFVSVASPGR